MLRYGTHRLHRLIHAYIYILDTNLHTDMQKSIRKRHYNDFCFKQCCGSVRFGITDPFFRQYGTVADKRPTKNMFVFQSFFACYFLKVPLHQFSWAKSQNSRNRGFSYFFCLMIEGSGSIHRTSGSGPGSRRAKNIRIRNTAFVFALRSPEKAF